MDRLEQIQHTALVIKCQIGDRQALETLFLRHHRALSYYLRRMLGREDVSDVQQEVWLTVIRRIARLKSPEAFVVWLYQIARNKAIDKLTDKKALASLENGDAGDPGQLPAEDPEPEFRPEDAAQIHAGLTKLSAEHREVLLLRFMEEMSYEQMADVIGIGAGTVRSRLHYAKLALRRLLETQS